jgi:hypothetical protein
MGVRANFIVIRDGQATAYYDNWAGRGCICTLADGPDVACEALAEYEKTNSLMEWSYAEGGYLIDFDENQVIVFGPTINLDEIADEDGYLDEGLRQEFLPFTEAGLPYLRYISDMWRGWKLAWDDHGTDAFAAHLRRRGITGIAVQPDSHPKNTEPPVELQA